MLNRVSILAFIALVLSIALSGCCTSVSKIKTPRCYEMRTYYSPAGRLDDLHARFRDHTIALFQKHGIESVGYWVPQDNSENKLIYLLSYPSREAREQSWKEFMADPEWQSVWKKSEANGKLVAKIDQAFLQTTDYSPLLKTGNISHGGVFELRTYTTPPGFLPKLDTRFREHTMELFKKHGMKNWVYFHKMPDQTNADTTLVYFLAHKSAEAGKASFAAFRADPKWIVAKTASEKDGSLTVKDGVKSEILVPTDYSPTK